MWHGCKQVCGGFNAEALAAQAAQLTVFQRTANFSIPARNRPLAQQEVARVKADYPQYRRLARVG